MSSTSNSSLRPAWARNKGFQPPPAQIEQQQQQRTSSETMMQTNKFAALDEDILEESVNAAAKATASATSSAAATNSRSEALRPRSKSTTSSGVSGRSLADLAARSTSQGERGGGGGRFSNLRNSNTTSSSSNSNTSSNTNTAAEKSVKRLTRERLLSMRPPPNPSPPEKIMKELEGSVILSETPQDPVCWDNFDAEEIWAKKKEEMAGTARASRGARRDSSGAGRWQRGVALPTDAAKRSSSKEPDAEDPSDLWDDPVSSDAAGDFSAFGSMPPEEKPNEPFDFEKMAEATAKFEEELHGRRSRTSSTVSNDSDNDLHVNKVDPSRPLASVGTTIRSGSGDDVNVFEDFDEPEANPEPVVIKAADEDPSASSRLMAMIGVKKEEPENPPTPEPSPPPAPAPAPDPLPVPVVVEEVTPAPEVTGWGDVPVISKDTGTSIGGIPLNPWGDPILAPIVSAPQPSSGLDLQARLREAEQKAAEEENRRRLEQEEAQRRQQEQERARIQQQRLQQQQQQQQQQAGVQSQVELVLMERISTILENSWGRSDLHSILATLHNEDTRVIPLLNNVDALRALLLRNPQRVVIRQDPALRAEMAALLMTNAQWQQAQQQQQQQRQEQARRRQEEMQRREQQRRLEEQQAAAAAVARAQRTTIVPDAPWFYSDPSKNIQGPFRGEEMRQWLEAGYFKGDLPISQSATGPFRALAEIFPDMSVAFVNQQNAAAAAEAEARAQAEEQARREQEERARAEAEAAELKRRKEQEELERKRREQEEANRRAQEAEAAAAAAAAAAKSQSANGGNESSAQLKLLLGLGSQASTETQSQSVPSEPVASPQSQPIGRKSKKGKAPKQPSPTPEETSAAANKSPSSSSPAWGGVAVKQQTVSRKSMSEIQKEEARAAAVASMNRQGTRASSSGWANVAASRGGSSAWADGTAKQTPAVVISNAAMAGKGQGNRSMSMPAGGAAAANAQTVAKGHQQRSTSVTGDSAAAENFGANMTPALERWCRDQMMKLNGTDDITLVTFCMTLNDPEEIRQYLAAYLGASPQVNNFATEFINRKGGNKESQDEWESTVNTKKNRKKKGGR